MGISFNPDEPAGHAGVLARAWRSLRGDPPDSPTSGSPHQVSVPPYGSPTVPTVGVPELPQPTEPSVPVGSAPAGGLTAADVAAVRFQPTNFREGYDQAQVDAFLDRVQTALRERAAGRPAGLTAADVANVAFQSSRLRAGYDQGEVDVFLDRIGETLA